MKLTIFLFTAAILNASAKTVSQTVTFSGNNVKLSEVFSSVEKQTGFTFIYFDSLLTESKPVTIAVKNAPLTDFLNLILKNQPYGFRIKKETIVINEKRLTPQFLLFSGLPPVTGIVA